MIHVSRRYLSRAAWVAAAMAAATLLFLLAVPVVKFTDPLSTAVFDRNGRLLGATVAEDGQWRFGMTEEVPYKFERALVFFEDKRFYIHPGVDPLALIRAAWQDIKAGRIVSGGSTITMQVARLYRKNKPRTVLEKIVEMFLALRLEFAKSKREILRMFASYAPFGGNVVGIDAAAWLYFGRPASALSWAEAAMLAVLPNEPALVHPARNRKRLKSKRNRLLDILVRENVIDAETARLAKEEPLPQKPHPIPAHVLHLLQHVQNSPTEKRGMLHTTIDAGIQSRVEDILQRQWAYLHLKGINNIAALAVDIKNGDVLAYAGNVPKGSGSEQVQAVYVDIITSPRSSGSILKPILYAAMLDSGEILPDQLVKDVKINIHNYSPKNFDRKYRGAVKASEAITKSLNIPAVSMLYSYGLDRFHSVLREVGFTTIKKPAEFYGLPIIIGGAEVTLWDAVSVYVGLARCASTGGGRRLTYNDVHVLKEGGLLSHKASVPFAPAACYFALKAMLEVKRPGVDEVWRRFASSRWISWKTGTSIGFRDAWAVGVTPDYAVGVWAGNANGEGMADLIGYKTAAPIMFEVFDTLPKSSGWFKKPIEDMKEITVCAHSGFPAGPDCGDTVRILVPNREIKVRPCPYCRIVHCDKSCTHRVHAGCYAPSRMKHKKRFVLPPFMARYYAAVNPAYKKLPPYKKGCVAVGGGLAIVFPRNGDEVFVPIGMSGKREKLIFEAVDRDEDAVVYWHMDGAYMGMTREHHKWAVSPPPGRHKLTLVDSYGRMVDVWFTVLSRADGGGDTDQNGRRKGR